VTGRREEFESEHPEVRLNCTSHDRDLAEVWDRPSVNWIARADGSVAAAGNGMADLLDCLELVYGPTQAELARRRQGHRALLLRQRDGLLARKSELLDQVAQVDAALDEMDAVHITGALTAWEAEQAARHEAAAAEFAAGRARREERLRLLATPPEPGAVITVGHWTGDRQLTVLESDDRGTVRARDEQGREFFAARLRDPCRWYHVCGRPTRTTGSWCRAGLGSGGLEPGQPCDAHKAASAEAAG